MERPAVVNRGAVKLASIVFERRHQTDLAESGIEVGQPGVIFGWFRSDWQPAKQEFAVFDSRPEFELVAKSFQNSHIDLHSRPAEETEGCGNHAFHVD